MKLSELLKNETFSLSFEVFPPKTDTAFESVKHATEEIAKLPCHLREMHHGKHFIDFFLSSFIQKLVTLIFSSDL